MSSPKLMHQVDDGVINGHVEKTRKACAVCGHTTMVIRPHLDTLARLSAEEIDPTATILKYLDRSPYMGIGCGCYAKFHRQIAHIRDRKRERKHH